MTRTSNSITPNEIEDTFERCRRCGTYAVQITDSHYCDSRFTSNLTDTERNQRITNDPYPADETVAIVNTWSSKTYAYHELTDGGQPLCKLTTDHPLDYRSRTDAQTDQHAPCQLCQRIRHSREADQ